MPVSEMEFLNAFFDLNEDVCMRAFPDGEKRGARPLLYRFPLKNIADYLPEMRAKNKKNGCGIHFTVNYGGQTDKEIQRINAVFFEIDNLSFDEQLNKIAKSPLEPSIIVKTRKSLHVYLLVKDVPVDKFRMLQERLAFFFKSDPQLKNESHTMRMPNFYHVKKDPVLVTVAKFDPDIRYSFAEINAVLPKLPPKPQKKKNSILPMRLQNKNDVVRYIRGKLEIACEKQDKIVCHCLFPEKHANNDATPSAVFFKNTLYFHCSGCGVTYSIYELADKMGWDNFKKQLYHMGK